MLRRLLSFGVLLVLLVVIAQTVRSQSGQKNQTSSDDTPAKDESKPKQAEDRSADEAAIRANIAQFAKAYDAGDAKAVAALFTPDAYIVGKEGNTTHGREGIARTFAEIFKNKPEKNIEIVVESIRFIGPDLAVEVGKTKVAKCSIVSAIPVRDE